MSVNSNFYLDAAVSRHELRDMLVRADIGLEADADYKKNAGAVSPSTSVSIRDDLSEQSARADNGVIPTRFVGFHCRTKNDQDDYWTESVRGVFALLKALPEADAYWVILDGLFPALIRRKGQLVLSSDMTDDNGLWDPAGRPLYLALVDLPYTMEPLGRHWNYIDSEWFRPAVKR